MKLSVWAIIARTCTRDTPRANNRTLRSKRPTSVRMLLLCLRPRLLLLCLLPRLLLFLQLLLKAHLLPRLLLHPETTCVAERAVAAPPGRLRGMTHGARPSLGNRGRLGQSRPYALPRTIVHCVLRLSSPRSASRPNLARQPSLNLSRTAAATAANAAAETAATNVGHIRR